MAPLEKPAVYASILTLLIAWKRRQRKRKRSRIRYDRIGALEGLRVRSEATPPVDNNNDLPDPEAARAYCNWLLQGPEHIFKQLFRMTKTTFQKLCRWLADNTTASASRHQSLEQKVMIILWLFAYNEPQRNVALKFKVSQASVSRIFHELKGPLRQLHKHFVRQPDPTYLSPTVELNPKFSQFSGAIGAIDGTHIKAFIPLDSQKRWWSRKGYISQNVLVAVTLDGLFSYVMPGAEGSMHDSALLAQALTRGFKIPDNRFYIADAGFGLRRGILVPYNGLYHIPQWVKSDRKPETDEEIFNLRHSQIRTIVEQSIGMCKRRWKIIRDSSPEYNIRDQISIIFAVTALFNFIQLGGRTPQDTLRDDIAALDQAQLHTLVLASARCNSIIPKLSAYIHRELVKKWNWEQYRGFIEELQLGEVGVE